MIVICLSDCPPKLRGDITKWLAEINTGVYVGNLSARVREELWERICKNLKDGRATMIYSAPGEQKMAFRVLQGFCFLFHPVLPVIRYQIRMQFWGHAQNFIEDRNLRQHRTIHGTHLACIIFRHIAQKFSAIHKVFPQIFRQSDENSDCAICVPELCGIALSFFVRK